MNKHELKNIFLQKGILSNKSGRLLRPFCWKNKFDEEAQNLFHEFALSYSTEEEAWFCLCRDVEVPLCPVCQMNRVKFTGITKNGHTGFNTTCENCSANAVPEKIAKIKQKNAQLSSEQKNIIEQKRKATNLLKHGDENYMSFGSKSFKAMMKQKYGNSVYNNPLKIKQTCLEKYGVSTNLLIPEIHRESVIRAWSEECRNKRIENCLMRHGVPFPCMISEAKIKMVESKKKKILEIESALNCTLLATVTKKYGQGYKNLGLEYLRIGNRVYVQNKDIPIIEQYYLEGTHTNQYVSKPEKDVLEYVKSLYSGEIVENCTSVVPNGNHRFFELDIYFPELRFAIDFNGTYWHSTKFKDDLYHQRKTDYCRKAGVHLLHVFEDFWNNSNAKCKQIITECLTGTFNNIISKSNGVFIGDNSFPIFGEYDILDVTPPEPHQIGSNVYYDCGKILYERKGEYHEQ